MLPAACVHRAQFEPLRSGCFVEEKQRLAFSVRRRAGHLEVRSGVEGRFWQMYQGGAAIAGGIAGLPVYGAEEDPHVTKPRNRWIGKSCRVNELRVGHLAKQAMLPARTVFVCGCRSEPNPGALLFIRGVVYSVSKDTRIIFRELFCTVVALEPGIETEIRMLHAAGRYRFTVANQSIRVEKV